MQCRHTSPVKGHTSLWICLFSSLQSIQQLTAPNWTPAACLSRSFVLDQSPWAGKHINRIQKYTYTYKHTHIDTHALTCMSTHRHAEIVAHKNQPQHEHPHTNTHINDTVAHSARHRWLSQLLSNTHHNTGWTVKAWLQGVAGCGACWLWSLQQMELQQQQQQGRWGEKQSNRLCQCACVCMWNFCVSLHKSFTPAIFRWLF